MVVQNFTPDHPDLLVSPQLIYAFSFLLFIGHVDVVFYRTTANFFRTVIIKLFDEASEFSVSDLAFAPVADVWLNPVETSQNSEVLLWLLV